MKFSILNQPLQKASLLLAEEIQIYCQGYFPKPDMWCVVF